MLRAESTHGGPTMMKTILAGIAVAALLAGCGGQGTEPVAEASSSSAPTTEASTPTPSRTPSASRTPTATRSPASASPMTTKPAQDVPLELQGQMVANVIDTTFGGIREDLLAALKLDPRVEAVEHFDFDKETSTLGLTMASTFRASEDAMSDLAYEHAGALAPAMWAPEVADQVTDPAVLPTFDLRVDDLHFRCDGGTMAALADKELSQVSFTERCRV